MCPCQALMSLKGQLPVIISNCGVLGKKSKATVQEVELR